MARAKIQIEGLRELQKALRATDRDLPKAMRVALNKGSTLVVDYAKQHVEHKSGAAAGSLKVRSSQTAARVAAGGRKAPYYPWLDFGGAVGPGKSVKRPFYTDGRYIYVGLRKNRDEITEVMSVALTEVARQAGLEVS